MRSRYAAYVLGEVDYVLATTHPEGPHFREDRGAWRSEVEAFCRDTEFQGLEVLEVEVGEDRGEVRFRVQLRQAGADAGFTEHSTFLRRGGRWLYHSGEAG